MVARDELRLSARIEFEGYDVLLVSDLVSPLSWGEGMAARLVTSPWLYHPPPVAGEPVGGAVVVMWWEGRIGQHWWLGHSEEGTILWRDVWV